MENRSQCARSAATNGTTGIRALRSSTFASDACALGETSMRYLRAWWRTHAAKSASMYRLLFQLRESASTHTTSAPR